MLAVHMAAGAASGVYGLNLPLMLNERYLGDIFVEVDEEYAARVDAERFAELLADRVAADLLPAVDGDGDAQLVTPEQLSSGQMAVRFDRAELMIRVDLARDRYRVVERALAGRTERPREHFAKEQRFSLALDVGYLQEYVHRSEFGSDGTQDPDVVMDSAVNLFGFDGINLAASGVYRGEPDAVWERGEALAFHDDYETATRFAAGDIAPPLRGFQASPRLGGVGVSRRYGEIRPFQNIRASGRREFTLDRASRVDVEVDGVVQRTEILPPGRYRFTDFPLAMGSNRVRLLVADETGQRALDAFSLFFDPQLLGAGITDFAASVGRIEDTADGPGIRYDDTLGASAFVEHGITDGFDIALDTQHSEDGVSAYGVGLTAGLTPGIVEFDLTRSELRDERDTGAWAGGIRFTRTPPVDAPLPVEVRIGVDYFGPGFRSLSDPDALDTQRLFTTGRIQVPVPGGWSLGLGSQFRELREPERRILTTDISLSRSLAGRGSLFAGITREEERVTSDSEYSAFIGVSFPFGQGGLVRGRYDSRDDRWLAQAQKLPRRELGNISGSASVGGSDERMNADARARYLGNRVGVEAEFRGERPDGDRNWTDTRSTLRLNTGVGITPDGMGVGRATTRGFALVRPHSTLDDRVIEVRDRGATGATARTDWLGPAVVPIRRGYIPETLDIDVEDLPLGYDIGSGQAEILPGAFSGYAFEIGSDDSRTIRGVAVDREGAPIARRSGRLVAEGDDRGVPLFTNAGGRFVAEQVAPGRYRLEFGALTSSRPVTIDAAEEGLIDVGTVVVE